MTIGNRITLAKYTKNRENEVCAVQCVIDGEHWSVTLREENRHYRMIQEWVAEGNVIEEAD